MKSEKSVRNSARAAWKNAMKAFTKCANAMEYEELLLSGVHAKRAEDVTDANMADLRDYAAEFVRHINEFNAYRNCAEWNENDREKSNKV